MPPVDIRVYALVGNSSGLLAGFWLALWFKDMYENSYIVVTTKDVIERTGVEPHEGLKLAMRFDYCADKWKCIGTTNED